MSELSAQEWADWYNGLTVIEKRLIQMMVTILKREGYSFKDSALALHATLTRPADEGTMLLADDNGQVH